MLIHAPKPRLTLRVGITGHRPNKLNAGAVARIERRLPAVFAAIEAAVAGILKENGTVYAAEPPVIRLACGFAEGADQMALDACPSTWQIEALLPFPMEEYLKDFQKSAAGDGRDVSSALLNSLKKASTVTQLPLPRPDGRDKGYADAGGYLLRQIDLLVVVWDGKPPKTGGTGALARRAFDGGIPVVWISTAGEELPRLITDFDPRGGPIAPDVDCTDGPLVTALWPILAAPTATANRQSHAPPLAALERFFAERWQPRCYWTAYDFFWRVAGWHWPRLAVHSKPLESRLDEWGPFLAAAPEADQLRDRISQVLLPRFIWADTLAVYYAHRYRSAYVLAYLMSALAVFIALVSMFFDTADHKLLAKVLLVVFELVVIGGIIVMVWVGRRGLWQERWLDYRGLAERLRHSRFLAFVSEFGHIHEADPEGEGAQPSWILWYVRATLREIGLPNARLDATYQWKLLEATLTHEIEGKNGQLEYHRSNREASRRMDHLLHDCGIVCFCATFVVLVSFLAGAFAYRLQAWWSGFTAEAGPSVVAIKHLVTLFAAGLPALGAALAGIRVQGDFEGAKERSAHMLYELEELAGHYRIAERHEVELESTAEMLISTARTMSEDVTFWHELYGRKRLTLPA